MAWGPRAIQIIEGSPLQKVVLGGFLGLWAAWEGEPLLFVVIFVGALFYGLRRRDLFLPTVLFFSFCYGSWRFVPPKILDQVPYAKKVRIEALVVKPPLWLKGYTRFEVEIRRVLTPPLELHLRARLYAPGHPRLQVGDVFQGLVYLKRPQGYRNPFSHDTKKALATRGIYLVGRLLTRPPPEVLCKNPGHVLQALRARLFSFATHLSPEARGLFEALILGEKVALSPLWQNAFRRLGLAHLLAVSGLHLALLSSLAFGALGLFTRIFPALLLSHPARTWGLCGALVLGGVYVVFSGPSPSALRAYVMLLVWAGAYFLGRESRALDNLALAVLLVLIFWPEAVGALSFQLSVAAVLGLVVAARIKPYKWPWFLELFYFSAAALLFTAPLSFLAFGGLCPLAPLTNVLALPVFTFLVLPLEFLAAALSWWAPDLAAQVASGPVFFLRPWVKLKGFCWSPPLPVGVFLLGLLPLGGFFLAKRYRWFWLAVFVLCELGAYGLYRSTVFVSVLDVGQGSAAVARLKDQVILFDAGPRRGDLDTGSLVVAPSLRKLGLNHIDLVVLSHPQTDHVGGLWGVTQGLSWGKILMGSFEKRGFYQKILQDFSPGVEILWAPKVLSWDEAKLFLFPGRAQSALAQANREGLVARLCLRKDICVLFPGDIDKIRERRLLGQGFPLASLVLVLAHHGSRSANSQIFLKAVSPKEAFCSARSRFHPAQVVRKRLAKLGIPLLCTKEAGALTLWVRDGKVWVCQERVRCSSPWPFKWLWPLWPIGCKPL